MENKNSFYTEDGYQLITDFKTYAEIGQSDKEEKEELDINVYRRTNHDYEEYNMKKLVRAWNAFNEVLPTFQEYYEGKNERMLLQSIFSKELQIAKKLKIPYEDVPIGIFCSTRDDLIKLDYFLENIIQLWKPQESKVRKFFEFLGRLKFRTPWRLE